MPRAHRRRRSFASNDVSQVRQSDGLVPWRDRRRRPHLPLRDFLSLRERMEVRAQRNSMEISSHWSARCRKPAGRTKSVCILPRLVTRLSATKFMDPMSGSICNSSRRDGHRSWSNNYFCRGTRCTRTSSRSTAKKNGRARSTSILPSFVAAVYLSRSSPA